MKKSISIKRIRVIAICTVLLFGLTVLCLPHTARAAAEDSGSCGDRAIWSVDDSGTLTISGTGEMYDYSQTDRAPWFDDHRSSIRKIVISGGITYIGERAFFGCTALNTVEFGNTVKEIGSSAFMSCSSVKSMILPASVTDIDDFAFNGCRSLETIAIREGVESIGESVFEDCNKLSCVHYTAGRAQWMAIYSETDIAGDILEYDHGNGFDSGTVTRAATCSSEGEKIFRCSKCEDTRTEILPKEPSKHTWGVGVMTRQPTTARTGIRRFTCTGCGAVRDETIPKLKSTAKPVLNARVKAGSKSARVTWNRIDGADRYVIYFEKCNRKKMTRAYKTISGGRTSLKIKIKNANTQEYKVRVVAQKKNNGAYKVVAASLTCHFASLKNIKHTNPEKITVGKTRVTLKQNETFSLKAKVKKASKNKSLLGHASRIRYRTNDVRVASVDAGGVVTGKRPGKCRIYAVAENGLTREVTVTVQ